MPGPKAGAVQSRPPRYDDIVAAPDDASPAAVTGPASTSPASAMRGNAIERGTFRVEAADDFASDPDRRNAKPRAIVDLVSRLIGLDTAYAAGATFDWCRDYAHHRMPFSRLYAQDGTKPGLLVDLFTNEMAATKEEVAHKQAAIRAHNAEATALVEKTMADVEAQVFAAVERESEKTADRNVTFDGPVPDIEARVKAAQADAMLYLRREGLVPFGYLPIVGMPREINVEALLDGAILDIPPR